MTGFLEMLMRRATLLREVSNCLFISAWRAREAADGHDGRVALIGIGFLRIPAVTSLGKSTRTGPGRPDVAISKASLIRLGSSATFLTMTFHFVQALLIP